LSKYSVIILEPFVSTHTQYQRDPSHAQTNLIMSTYSHRICEENGVNKQTPRISNKRQYMY